MVGRGWWVKDEVEPLGLRLTDSGFGAQVERRGTDKAEAAGDHGAGTRLGLTGQTGHRVHPAGR